MQRMQESATLTWKYVDGEALSSLGLTSGVRKVKLLLCRIATFLIFVLVDVPSKSLHLKITLHCFGKINLGF